MDAEKAQRIRDRIYHAARNVDPRIFPSEIDKVIREERPDAETLLYVMSNLPNGEGDQWTRLAQAPEILSPYLQATIAKEQVGAAVKLTRSANFLAWAATIFGALQALFAVLSYFHRG